MCLFNKEKQENNKSGLVIFSICLLYHLIEKQQTDGSYSWAKKHCYITPFTGTKHETAQPFDIYNNASDTCV